MSHLYTPTSSDSLNTPVSEAGMMNDTDQARDSGADDFVAASASSDDSKATGDTAGTGSQKGEANGEKDWKDGDGRSSTSGSSDSESEESQAESDKDKEWRPKGKAEPPSSGAQRRKQGSRPAQPITPGQAPSGPKPSTTPASSNNQMQSNIAAPAGHIPQTKG